MDGVRGCQTNSFYRRVIETWNNLPAKTVNAATMNGFKNALDEAWKEKSFKFDYKATTTTTSGSQRHTSA